VELRLRRGDALYQVRRSREGGRTVFHLRHGSEPEGEALPLEVEALGGGDFLVAGPAGPRRGHAVRDGETIWVELDGATFRLEVARAGRGRGAGPGAAAVSAPMPGQVLRALVAVGDRVRRGQPLLVVEAMKMQIEISAPHDGVVARLPFAPGDRVDAGSELAEVEPGEGGA
jgi:acetyl/propionyl-CoA carboxylase alpha subunit